MPHVIVSLATAAALAAFASLPAAGGAAGTAPAASIVFASDRDGDGHLYTIASNGSGRKRLTSGPGFDVTPTWSPGRKWVAFASTRQSGTVAAQDIHIVRSDGTQLRALVETSRDESGPGWSPDGRSIVFGGDSTGAGRYDLYVVRVSTGVVRRLTSTRATEGVPAWSPNGKLIAYSRDGEIWLMRPDGTRAHGLGKAGTGVDWAPDWSPDSRRIAFESNSRTSPVNPVAEIWVMRSDGSQKRRITPYSRKRPVASVSPSWSPGGAQIAFSRRDQLWTMRPDGTRPRQLTRPPGGAWSPDW
jgi:Tol biopolymer transport system component